MKKIMAIILCVLLVVSLTACTWNASSTDTSESDGRMKLIFSDGFAIIYVDTETGVQYFSRSSCGTCVLGDENGNPIIYGDLEARK